MIAGFCRFVVRTFFREIVIDGEDNLPQGKPVIFTPNHPNSLLDPLLMFLFHPRFQIRFVAKSTLFKIPIFGSILRSIGAIPVVRKFEAAGEVDYSAFFSSCVQALQNDNSIVIFPEGRSLPQPYLAPLKTGPARLFLLAREKGVDVRIIPIGLNYERAMIFRSSVLISIAPAVATANFERENSQQTANAVRDLTEELTRALDERVFQAENFRDRELMLLLEKINSEEDTGWPERLTRLKQFENAQEVLRQKFPDQIDDLRQLLSRYQRILQTHRITNSSGSSVIADIFGFLVASVGVLLNWIPYHLVDWLVRGKDEADAATTKVIYAAFLFPIFYVAEGWALAHFFGWPFAVLFAVLIIPLTFFTLRFFEQREESGTFWRFRRSSAKRVADQLQRLRKRINALVDSLAEQL